MPELLQFWHGCSHISSLVARHNSVEDDHRRIEWCRRSLRELSDHFTRYLDALLPSIAFERMTFGCLPLAPMGALAIIPRSVAKSIATSAVGWRLDRGRSLIGAGA